jgi:hypothetical protein
MMTEKQAEFVRGLRELADWLEASPEWIGGYWNALRVDDFVDTQDEFRAKARLLGGERRKDAVGNYLSVERFFGPHRVAVNVSREKVCERVVVGTREVPAEPARVEEIVEWRCEPSILDTPRSLPGLPDREGYSLGDPKLVALDQQRGIA